MKPPPKKLGVTHWSTRLLATRLGISAFTVAEAWRDYGIKPWRSESFRFSTDTELEARVIDFVSLYLATPENAIVLCVDEKSQIQALDRTMPLLPTQPGLIEHQDPGLHRRLERPLPVFWTRTADDILNKANRMKTPHPGH